MNGQNGASTRHFLYFTVEIQNALYAYPLLLTITSQPEFR